MTKSFRFTPLRCVAILAAGVLLVGLWHFRTPTTQTDLAQYGIAHALEQIQ